MRCRIEVLFLFCCLFLLPSVACGQRYIDTEFTTNLKLNSPNLLTKTIYEIAGEKEEKVGVITGFRLFWHRLALRPDSNGSTAVLINGYDYARVNQQARDKVHELFGFQAGRYGHSETTIRMQLRQMPNWQADYHYFYIKIKFSEGERYVDVNNIEWDYDGEYDEVLEIYRATMKAKINGRL